MTTIVAGSPGDLSHGRWSHSDTAPDILYGEPLNEIYGAAIEWLHYPRLGDPEVSPLSVQGVADDTSEGSSLCWGNITRPSLTSPMAICRYNYGYGKVGAYGLEC